MEGREDAFAPRFFYPNALIASAERASKMQQQDDFVGFQEKLDVVWLPPPGRSWRSACCM